MDAQRGEAVAVVNGHAVPLPPTSPDGVQEVAIDPAWLAEKTTIEFRCAEPATANGFVLCAASVNLWR